MTNTALSATDSEATQTKFYLVSNKSISGQLWLGGMQC